MQLHPREQFTIVRQIEDHTDSSTYYVRAVIRNAKTDALIQVNGNDFLNLTDRGNRRFSESWLVPADVSGQGFWVSVLTSIYTDSGYTTKSPNYGDKMDTYLVQDRVNANLGGMGGGGADVDYKKVKKIVEEVVKANKPEMPNIPKVITVEKEVVRIPTVNVPPAPSLDPVISSVEKSTKDILKAIKDIPEVPETDFEPLIELISKSIEDLKTINKEVHNNSSKEITNTITKLSKRLDTLKINVELQNPTGKVVEDKTEPADERITKLMKQS